MDSCIFCRIANGDIPSTQVYADAQCIAFEDLHPQAAVHVLIIPRSHMDGLQDLEGAGDSVLAACLRAAQQVALRKGIAATGYRLISNVGDHGCQSVRHLHFHLLGGQQLPDRMA